MVQERKIPAHRVVLAAASHFFNLMFTTNMLESKSFEVELKDAEPDIIEQLVEFAYTARISVNSNNVQSLLDAANQYQIEPVKKMCVDFLKEQVDASNCLGISVLAECLDCPELKATADDFIHQHFTEVYKTDEFLQLDVKRVTHLLNQDTLTVRAEDQVTKLPSHNILSKNVPMDFLHFIFGYMITKRIILGEMVFTLNRVFQILFHGC